MPATARLLAAACLLYPALPGLAGTVTLKNGDQLEGTVVEESDEGVTLEHKTLGTLDLGPDQVKGVGLSHDDPAYDGKGNGLNAWLFPGWDKTLEAGFTGSDGNSDTFAAYGAFRTDYEDENDRWKIDANLFYASDDGENTRSEYDAGVLKDWLLPDEPYFYFATGRYEHDRFTGWEDRLSAFGGIGKQLVKEDDFKLIGRLGAGGNYEFGSVNEFTPEALIGLEGTWQIEPNAKLTFYNNLYPALDPFLSEFRNVTGAAYKVSVNAGRGLSIKLGVENEYDSEVEPGTEHNDLKYYGSLVYDF